MLLDALAARLDPPGRPRLGERALLPLPRRHGLRRRRGPAGRAPRLAQALRRPPALRLGRLRHLAAPLRPHAARTSRCTTPTATSSTTATSPSASTPTPTPTSAPGRSTSRPTPTLDRGLAVVTVRTLDAVPARSALLGSALGAGTRLRTQPPRRLPRRRRRGHRRGLRPVPVPGRRRLPRRGRAPRVPPRARRPPPRHPPGGARGAPEDGEGDAARVPRRVSCSHSRGRERARGAVSWHIGKISANRPLPSP